MLAPFPLLFRMYCSILCNKQIFFFFSVNNLLNLSTDDASISKQVYQTHLTSNRNIEKWECWTVIHSVRNYIPQIRFSLKIIFIYTVHTTKEWGFSVYVIQFLFFYFLDFPYYLLLLAWEERWECSTGNTTKVHVFLKNAPLLF